MMRSTTDRASTQIFKSLSLVGIFLVGTLKIYCDEPTEHETQYTWQGAWYVWPVQGGRGRVAMKLNRTGDTLTGTISVPEMGIENEELVGGVRVEPLSGSSAIEYFVISDINQEISFHFESDADGLTEQTEVTGEFYLRDKFGGYWYLNHNPEIQSFNTIEDFQISTRKPVGIAFDGTHLQVAEDYINTALHQFDLAGQYLGTDDVVGIFLDDMAFSGEQLVTLGVDLDSGKGAVTNIEDGTTFALLDRRHLTGLELVDDMPLTTNWDGELLQWHPDGQATPLAEVGCCVSAIATDGTHLWLAQEPRNTHFQQERWTKILKLDMSGAIRATYYSPLKHITDMTFDGTHLWAIEIGHFELVPDHSGSKAVKISL